MHGKLPINIVKIVAAGVIVIQMLLSQNGTEADNLAATERLFSSYTVDNGIKDGFVKYFDDSCVVFRPFAVNGHEWYAHHKPIRGILSWYPTYVLVCASGELGISTGPWEYRDSSVSDPPSGYGHFFSVWKKNSHREWKVVLDMGNSYEKKEGKKEKKEFILSAGRPNSTENDGLQSVRSAETSLAMMVKTNGLKSGIESAASKNLRVYRKEKFPGSNKNASLALIAKETDKFTLQLDRIFVAGSGDLAYSFGIAVSSSKDTSNFVHVWRNEGKWELIVDIMEPVKK